MVRIITLLSFAFFLQLNVYGQSNGHLPIPKGEANILYNFSYAIDAYYKRNQKLPASLLDIRNETNLTSGMSPELAVEFAQRYALLPKLVHVPDYGMIVMVSIVTFQIPGETESLPSGRRAVVYIQGKLGEYGSGYIPTEEIDSILNKKGIILKPIDVPVPLPTTRPDMSVSPSNEYTTRAFDAFNRGEIPVTSRNDKEGSRAQETAEAKPAEIPAPVTLPPAKSSNQLSWIAGALAALVGGVLFVRRKKSKS